MVRTLGVNTPAKVVRLPDDVAAVFFPVLFSIVITVSGGACLCYRDGGDKVEHTTLCILRLNTNTTLGISKSMNRVDGYVKERELERIKVGAAARFIPDALEFGVYECTVAEIDRVNIPTIDEPFLASTYGGPIAARNDANGVATPDSPVFRVRMDSCFPGETPMMKLRGVAHINAEKRSKFIEIIKNYYALAIREIGF